MTAQKRFQAILRILLCSVSAVGNGVAQHIDASSVAPNTVSGISPLVVPMFVEDGTLTSTLVLVSDIGSNTYADVTVTGADGSTAAIERVSFPPHSQKRIEIGSLLSLSGSSVSSGRITVVQDPKLEARAIVGQLSMTDHSLTTSNYVDEEVSSPNPASSSVLRAVIGSISSLPVIAITSLTGSSQTIAVTCMSEEATKEKSVKLSENETLFVSACSDQTSQGVGFTESRLQTTGVPSGSMAISLKSDGEPGSFSAFALAKRIRGEAVSLVAMQFVDPAGVRKTATVYAGVPVGRQSLLSDGKYVPVLTVGNFSAKPANARITFSPTENGQPAPQNLAPVLIPPMSIKTMRLEGLQGAPELKNSFVLESDVAPGDLVSTLAASGTLPPFSVELIGKDSGELQNGGTHPWSLDEGTESTLLLFNPDHSPQDFDVHITGGAVSWVKRYKLLSYETKSLSLRALADDEVKDDAGATLSRDVLSGQVGWSAWGSGEQGRGRMLQSNRSLGVARNFSCSANSRICSASFADLVDPFMDGSTVGMGVMDTNVCSVQGDQCHGAQSYTRPSIATWSSANTQIAAIAAPSPMSTVQVHGVTPGTTNLTGFESVRGCTVRTNPPANVLGPTGLLFFSDVTGKSAACIVASQNSVERFLQYQIVGGPNKNTPMGGVSMMENFANLTTNTCNNLPPNHTPCTLVGGDGVFNDDISTNACSPPNPITCGFSLNPDLWQLCSNGVAIKTLGTPTYAVLWQEVAVDGQTAAIVPYTPVPNQ